MPPEGPIRKFAAEVAALIHADKKREAAIHVADFCKIKVKLDDEDPSKYIPVLASWLHWLLNNGAPELAASTLWTPTQFSAAPQFTQDLWKLYEETSMGLVMGAASCGKSFSLGVRLYLEYIRDPEWTAVKVIGPSEKHLEANLFSALVGLHTSASIPCPGHVGELWIGMDKRNMLGGISGVIIPVGQTRKAGRLQGMKRKPRPHPHPIFGPLSRLFVFADEIENIPKGLWNDIDNLLSQATESVGGFKICASYNPTDLAHEVATRAEPPWGWDSLNPDEHFRWKSRRGWDVLRLDGERCENVVQNKIIFPGLQTRAGLEAIARNAGGRDSAGYSTQGRGIYPKQGITITIIPPGMFPRWRGEFIWYNDPVPVAAADLALEGGSAAIYTLGRWGKASGVKLLPNLENPKGVVLMFKDKMGKVQPRFALQADSQHALPKGDSIAMAHRLIELNKKAGVKPEYFCVDRTGHGAGTADIIKHEFGAQIADVNYSQGASKEKLMIEDTQTCEESYDRVASELWFALRAFGEYQYLLINPAMDVSELTQQVTQRRMKTAGKKSHVESKNDYKDRGFLSPDQADSLTLLVHAARKGSGVILSRLGESIGEDGDDGEWWDGHTQQRIDPSNHTDTLL